jgi:hypothetical protein
MFCKKLKYFSGTYQFLHMLVKFIKDIAYNIEKCKVYETDISSHELVQLFNNYVMMKYNINCVVEREQQTIKMFRIDLGFVTQEYNYKKIKFVFNSYNYMNMFINHIIKHIKEMNTNDQILLIPLVLLIIDKDNIRKAHTIMLIYRKYKNSFEYYDSNGICNNTYIYNRTNRLIQDIVNEMNTNINEIKNIFIFKSINTSYYLGFNRIENEYGDHKGLCINWSMFFGELILLNPYMKTSDLMRNLYIWFNNNNNMNSIFLRNLIINYLYNIQKNGGPMRECQYIDSPGTKLPCQEHI